MATARWVLGYSVSLMQWLGEEHHRPCGTVAATGGGYTTDALSSALRFFETLVAVFRYYSLTIGAVE
jgi:hypothetical protein